MLNLTMALLQVPGSSVQHVDRKPQVDLKPGSSQDTRLAGSCSGRRFLVSLLRLWLFDLALSASTWLSSAASCTHYFRVCPVDHR
jgi:hypothetical protein